MQSQARACSTQRSLRPGQAARRHCSPSPPACRPVFPPLQHTPTRHHGRARVHCACVHVGISHPGCLHLLCFDLRLPDPQQVQPQPGRVHYRSPPGGLLARNAAMRAAICMGGMPHIHGACMAVVLLPRHLAGSVLRSKVHGPCCLEHGFSRPKARSRDVADMFRTTACACPVLARSQQCTTRTPHFASWTRCCFLLDGQPLFFGFGRCACALRCQLFCRSRHAQQQAGLQLYHPVSLVAGSTSQR